MADVVAVVYPVVDLEGACAFLQGPLHMAKAASSSGDACFENGALRLELKRVPGPQAAVLELELEARSFDSCRQELLGWPQVSAGPERRDGARVEQRFQAPHGLTLTLFKVLDEDELGVLPPLPATMAWSPEADGMVREMMRHVPLPFREAARKRATTCAEQRAAEEATGLVSRRAAIRGMLDATPAFELKHVRHGLQMMGATAEELGSAGA